MTERPVVEPLAVGEAHSLGDLAQQRQGVLGVERLPAPAFNEKMIQAHSRRVVLMDQRRSLIMLLLVARLQDASQLRCECLFTAQRRRGLGSDGGIWQGETGRVVQVRAVCQQHPLARAERRCDLMVESRRLSKRVPQLNASGHR